MNAHEKSSSLSWKLDDQNGGPGDMAALHHENLRESAESVDHFPSMRISEMNWMMVEEYLRRDDRAVLPLGCTEQHAYLSLSTDSILAERLAVEVAEPLGVPVFPVLTYGITPYFRAFPGTITLRVKTYMSVVGDILDAIAEHGFKRILIVNGHGGNTPVQGFVGEWIADHPGMRITFHNWWNAPKVWAQVQAIDPVASHASWMENFPWTRLPKVEVPSGQKAMCDSEKIRRLDPKSVREYLNDGNYGGLYQRRDEEMMKIWQTAVEETRALLREECD
jgi:creatinine amidohydrolase